MRRRLAPLLVFLILLLPLAGAAQAAQETPLRATLKNGLQVVIVRTALAPVVTTMMNYLVGSNEAPDGFPGTAHALEHMMFRGSPGLSADQLATIAAALGGEFNAATQQTVTQYFFTVPADALELPLRIEALRMRDIAAGEAAWRLERGAIEQEVAMDLSSPDYLLYSRLLALSYAGTVYAHDALGTRESFDKTTWNLLRGFHRRWYAPNNAILVIVGDVDPAQTLALVRTVFEPVPARKTPARPPVSPPPLRGGRIALDSDRSVGQALIAYRLPGYESPDYPAAQVLVDALDSSRGKLYDLVIAGKALGSGFEDTTLPKAGLGLATAAFGAGGDGPALVAEIKQAIAAVVRDGVPSDLVEAAKRRALTELELEKMSVRGLAAAWSQAVAVERRQSPDELVQAIQGVTVADVNRVARTYLLNDTAIVGLLTPQPAGAPVASPGPRRSEESLAQQPTKPVVLPEWARRALRDPELPTAISPTVFTLANGLRLLVRPDRSTRGVILSGAVKTAPELEVPPGREGLAEVLDGLLPYGTVRQDREQFDAAVDELGARVEVGTRFSVRALADVFPQAVGLLAENLLTPRLPDTAFGIVQKQTADAVAGRLTSPPYLATRAVRRGVVPADDPTLREATPESVRRITLEEVKAYHRATFRPDLTTIVVVGSVTPDGARSVVERAFGTWTATGSPPPTDLPPIPANTATATSVADPSRVQAEVTLAETLPLTRKHPDYYALQLGTHVLSGPAFTSRLFRELRERSGLVYAVDAQLDAGKTRTLFLIEYASDPANVGKARALAERELRDLQAQAVPAAELAQAKALLIRRLSLLTSSAQAVAGQLLALTLADLPLDEPVRAAGRYRALTPAEVQAAFAKWIRAEDFVQVTLGPTP